MSLMVVIFQIAGEFICIAITLSCALLYFQHVRLERPAIGVFTFQDVVIIFTFIIVLPFFYLSLPGIILISMLALTFASALYIGLRPLLRVRYLWLFIAFLLLSDIVAMELLPGVPQIWQLINSIIVVCAAVSVSNLYIQGGMRLKHVAWFTFFLGFYDGFTAFALPLTIHLAERFNQLPLGPAMGLSIGKYNVSLGLGDVLVYCLFMLAAYKAYGKRGAVIASVVIACFGMLLPLVSVLLILVLIPGYTGTILPLQAFFGPFALITYFWLSRRAPERTMAQWFAFQAAQGYRTRRVARRV